MEGGELPCPQQFENEKDISGVLERLERRMETETPAEQLWENLDAARTVYYGAMQEALANGSDFGEAKIGAEPHETA